jgi:NADH dehydrogenase FAD-containing subunit
VLLDSGTEAATVAYDTLVYALGSAADTSHVPGVTAHAVPIADLDSARELAKRVPDLAAERGVFAVVGGGLADDSPHETVLTGRTAARFKELVVRGALRATR